MRNIHLPIILSLFLLNCSTNDSGAEEIMDEPNLPSLTTSLVQEITQNSALSGGNISDDGGVSIIARGVCWSLNQNPTIQNDRTQDGNGIGEFTSVIEGLTANTTYFLRSYATNSVGTSYGEERSFTTSEVEAKIFDGDIVFLIQEEIDDFGNQGYTEITGNVEIGNINVASTTSISNLEGLSTINSVGGNLTLHANDALNSLEGLRNLEVIGGELFLSSNKAFDNIDGLNNLRTIGEGLRVVQNSALSNLDGLSNLTEIGNLLLIFNNDELVNVDGLNNLISVGFDIAIRNNDKLSEINSFNNLEFSTGLSISDNSTLNTINGFSSLKTIQLFLVIENNNSLSSFNGFGELESIGSNLEINNNGALTSLDGLVKLISLGESLTVIQNTELVDFCGIDTLIKTGFTGSYEVSENAYNPSQQEILNGNCQN
ncbi:hypothetical protein [Maribacter thermophilus]|uniref:hypothetical protein n=1 Tax=Maribacter thermophilus TaxID=1197874 RepID=UPI000641437C|nr:hypothetical protein [Maribacter thermophilus]